MRLMNEQHSLVCKYPEKLGIPEVVNVSAYSTALEELRLSSEGFHTVMIEHILPEIISPKFPIKELYEVDYYLILRRARIATWGPVFTAASYYCPNCMNIDGTRGKIHKVPRQVRLDQMGVLLPPEGEVIPTSVTIKRDEFIFLDCDVTFSMNKCKDLLLIEKKNFPLQKKRLLPMAASLRAVTGEEFVDISEAVTWLSNVPAADFKILEDTYIDTFSKYGLENRGEVECQECKQQAWFFAPVNDYYFRPTREDLREWKRILGDAQKTV